MKLIQAPEKISREELKKMSESMFDRIVKAVVDIEKEVMVVDAQMHSDQEHILLESGSAQKNLWGINFHPKEEIKSEEFVEFDSMINIRPGQGNRSRGVEDVNIQKKVKAIVWNLVKE